MVRGGPIHRSRDVRVRLTPAEHDAWTAARDQTGRRELGAWVRVVVNELLALPPGDRPARDVADQPQQPDQRLRDAAVYAVLTRTANNLNQLARWANTERRYPAEQDAAAAYRDVRAAVVELRAVIAAAGRRRRRTR